MYKVVIKSTILHLDVELRISLWVYKHNAQQWFDFASSSEYITNVRLERKKWFKNEWVLIEEVTKDVSQLV